MIRKTMLAGCIVLLVITLVLWMRICWAKDVFTYRSSQYLAVIRPTRDNHAVDVYLTSVKHQNAYIGIPKCEPEKWPKIDPRMGISDINEQRYSVLIPIPQGFSRIKTAEYSGLRAVIIDMGMRVTHSLRSHLGKWPFSYTKKQRGTNQSHLVFRFWFPTVLFAIYPVSFIVHVIYRRWYRHRKGLCLKCGYKLTGLPESRCPECGMAFDLQLLQNENTGKE
ncbi:MAG: hypothetical protein ACYTBZ_21165 [Planctomycetota bacterium]